MTTSSFTKVNTERSKIYWERIPGYQRYLASSDGFIKTFDWKGSGREAILKPALDGSGYLRTMLKSDSGKIQTIKVHRIIAQTFLANPENKATVNHKNGIKTDNRVENLEWMTQAENVAHSHKTGLARVLKGEEVGNSILTSSQVKEIRNKFKPFVYTKPMLAKEYEVTVATIKDIILKRTWKHV